MRAGGAVAACRLDDRVAGTAQREAEPLSTHVRASAEFAHSPATRLMAKSSGLCCEGQAIMRAGYSAEYGCSPGAHPTFQ